jgi:hypothetical protein
MLISTRKCIVSAVLVALGAGTAAAGEHISGILQHAKNLEKDSSQIRLALKSKKVDTQEVKSAVEASSADVAKLRELVAAYESTNPSLNSQERKDWELVKQKVQLLSIFHDRKKELVSSGDFSKNRGLIRAHAEGLAKRAVMLQNTVGRLQRSPLGSSGS